MSGPFLRYFSTISYAAVNDSSTPGAYYGQATCNVIGGGFPGNVTTSGQIYWYMTSNSFGATLSGLWTNGDALDPTPGSTYYLGAVQTLYYPTQAAAAQSPPNGITSEFGNSSSYTVTTFSGYTNWRIASKSTGTSPQDVVYTSGSSTLNALTGGGNSASYFLYPVSVCFLEGTTVLCRVDDVETYIPVEQLKPGTLVKTSLNGYKPVVLVGKNSIQNPGNDERIEERLYKLSPSKYPQLKDDLYLTGGHSVLEFPLTEKQTQDTIKKLGDLYVTEGKYRLLACIDERAEPWVSEGTYTIWAFALEHDDVGKNYGVYVNGELLVESCSVHYLKENSNMELTGVV